jgi:predicted ATPase
VIDHLVRAAAIAHDDTPETKRDKLEAAARAGASGERRCGTLLAELLSVPATQAYPALQLEPEIKRRTFKALSDYLLAMTRRATGLVVWEDIHWIDPTSRELLDHLVELSRSGAVAAGNVAARRRSELDWASACGRRQSRAARSLEAAALVRGSIIYCHPASSTRSSCAAMACRSSSRN